MSYSIAIDGPAGAGKSTIAVLAAKKLGFTYIDTGAMYRAMAVYFLDNNIDLDDENEVSKACGHVDIMIEYDNGIQQIILNGNNITPRLRTEEAGNAASRTAAYKKVREKLIDIQRGLAMNSDVVMDGRDIGSFVLPDAICKIYLTASVEKRAERRMLELKEKGMHADIESVKKDIADRDYRDMNREVSPLVKAEDAVLVDSSELGIEEVTDTIIAIFKEKAGK